MQVQAQKDHLAEQNQRCKDLEASTRQLEERCSELKESAAGHELRAKEAAAEVLKGNRIIEKVSVSTNLGCNSKRVIHGRTCCASQNKGNCHTVSHCNMAVEGSKELEVQTSGKFSSLLPGANSPDHTRDAFPICG